VGRGLNQTREMEKNLKMQGAQTAIKYVEKLKNMSAAFSTPTCLSSSSTASITAVSCPKFHQSRMH
jgi:hypothetical protein